MVGARRDIEREQNIMSTPVGSLLDSGEGEIVKKLLEMKSTMSSSQWTEVALLLQKLLRGPASLLENQGNPEAAQELSAIRVKAAAEDKALEAWNKDSQKFIEEVVDKSEKLIPNETTKEKLIAKGVKIYQEARNNAVASASSKRLLVIDALRNGPKETINVVGDVETVIVNGQPQAKIAPVVVSLGNQLNYKLEPGTQTVPKIIADRYHQMERSHQELIARQNALSENLEQGVLSRRLNKINRDFGAGGDAFPLAAS